MKAYLSLLAALFMIPALATAQGCTAVLVSDNPADYASASVLATKMDFTVITTPWGTLGGESLQGLVDSGCESAYILGGSTAIPGVAEEAMADYSITFERIGGRDRYETSALVALKWNTSLIVFIASGVDSQGIDDAAGKAVAVGAPVIFVRAKEAPAAVADAIARLKAKDARIIPSPDMDTSGIDNAIRKVGITTVEIVEIDPHQRANSAINEASAAIVNAEAVIGEISDARAMAAYRYLENARGHLNLAESARSAGNFAEAFARARAADENAENSVMLSSGVAAGYLKDAVNEARAEIMGLVKKRIDVGEIVSDPVKYDGREVQISGVVLSDPVYIGEKTYIEMQDDTGTIVIEKEGFMGPPLIDAGDTVEVTGLLRVNPAYGGPHGGEHSNLPSYIVEAGEIERLK